MEHERRSNDVAIARIEQKLDDALIYFKEHVAREDAAALTCQTNFRGQIEALQIGQQKHDRLFSKMSYPLTILGAIVLGTVTVGVASLWKLFLSAVRHFGQ